MNDDYDEFRLIEESVGNTMKNRGEDVRAVRGALHERGYGRADQRENKILTRDMDDAIKAYQSDHNLRVDGILLPGGETEMDILSEATENKNIPLPGRKPELVEGIAVEDVVKFVKRHEGNIDYLYLDPKGKVTVGVGRMLPSREAASKLPFEYFDRETGRTLRKATPEEVRKSFDIVEKQKSGQNIKAGSFDPVERDDLPNIRLRDDDINTMLASDLYTHMREAKKMFPDFHTFPPQVQMAILDMHFNMGGLNFTRRKWPGFFKAIDDKNWRDAALESSRKDVGGDRNKDVFRMLEEAHNLSGR